MPIRRLIAVSITVASLLVGAALLGACGGSSSTDRSAEPTTTTAAPEPPSTTTTTVDPATLPQTDERPSARTDAFGRRAQALADAIITDDPSKAMSAFFPLEAYKQVKKISNPTSDWNNRLIAEYVADIHAAHAQLGPNAARATYLGIDLPDGAATWVKPGEEYNQLPYWRVYGTTLRFDVGGQTRTIPASSFISWRGQWYVVHLGAIR